ncbi:hypothetical protein Lser_V15G44181 [Lactuca serriola]
MEHKMELEEKVVSRQKAEYDRMRAERERKDLAKSSRHKKRKGT